MLKFVDVHKTFRNGANVAAVLRGVNFTLEAGELLVLTGQSGSGKTTLLNLAGCLTRPTQGSIFIDSDEVSALPDHFLSAVRRDTIGFVFQQYNLLPGYTAGENVEIPLIPLGISERQRKERASALLAHVGLAQKTDTPIQRLSGGEQQRVAVARALINNPRLILADEPTSNVDAETATVIIELFVELRRQQRALIIASHDAVWQEIADREINMMADGQLQVADPRAFALV